MGARADYPLRHGWVVGGELRFEKQDEDIAPYVRESADAYVQVPLPRASTLRVSATRVVGDNIGSPEDIDLIRYSAILRTRPWNRAVLSAEFSQEDDTGGTLSRHRSAGSVRAEWRIRQLVLTGEARYVDERQGLSERDRTLVRAIVRREF